MEKECVHIKRYKKCFIWFLGKYVGTVIVLLAFAVSFAGSYAQIINILVTVSGRVGLGVYVFAIIYRLYCVLGDKKKEYF